MESSKILRPEMLSVEGRQGGWVRFQCSERSSARNWPWLWLNRNIHRKSVHWFAKITGQHWTGRRFFFKPSRSSGASLVRLSLLKQFEKWRRTTDQRHYLVLSESVYRGIPKDILPLKSFSCFVKCIIYKSQFNFSRHNAGDMQQTLS